MITIIHDSLASVGAKTGGHEDGVELFFFWRTLFKKR